MLGRAEWKCAIGCRASAYGMHKRACRGQQGGQFWRERVRLGAEKLQNMTCCKDMPAMRQGRANGSKGRATTYTHNMEFSPPHAHFWPPPSPFPQARLPSRTFFPTPSSHAPPLAPFIPPGVPARQRIPVLHGHHVLSEHNGCWATGTRDLQQRWSNRGRGQRHGKRCMVLS